MDRKMNRKMIDRALIGLMCFLLLQLTVQAGAVAPAGQSQGQSQDQSQAPAQQLSPQELQQLVAPIALYPDALVAQVLAASTYPTQIVEADRWMQSHSNLKGDELAKEVDKQNWDPSVKALTQTPSVLENMDKNLSWTSSLGEAYANDPQALTNEVQTLREQAQKAGKLNSNEQENVTTQGNTIVIQPANPDVVYVPAYDPWLVYGDPIVAYPGWYPVPGIFFGGPGLYFGAGFGIGFFGGFGWGWNHWGYDWHGHDAMFDHGRYISHSRSIMNHNDFHGGHANFNQAPAARCPANKGSVPSGSVLGKDGTKSQPGICRMAQQIKISGPIVQGRIRFARQIQNRIFQEQSPDVACSLRYRKIDSVAAIMRRKHQYFFQFFSNLLPSITPRCSLPLESELLSQPGGVTEPLDRPRQTFCLRSLYEQAIEFVLNDIGHT